ncbi:UDP-glucose--hexose-1-phosphate uridylyltransferase [Sediminibacillus massiliensis]|uniref:UDP-glucose--hexose-1-phosphate uridylyltransferase n=1 Tax=Sediminibacillus massiliensis TaxID=1926277 RepID=UPI0009885CDB|nr:UDP-glucose--hexose-1-phosphate uridylyltransferase [Sediminibacillus massiliensis]
MTIYQAIDQLINKGIQTNLIKDEDTYYVRNQLLGLLQLNDYKSSGLPETDKTIPDLLDVLLEYAVEKGLIENILDEKEIFSANIMDVFLPLPSTIHQQFYEKWEHSPIEATDYFYQLSKNSNYIQTKRISKNIHFKSDSLYGQLDITINLSKPEKDPEQIRREKELKQDIHYPKCLLCAENEGYVGRMGHPARSNHRIIKVPLIGENWYLQYSPYVYYNEHSIVLAEEHRDMKIDKTTFERLTAFVEKFPHYFLGSNADLPIVGGSILSHDHYQGGRYEFAMNKAEKLFSFALEKFPNIHASVIKWPLSVIRLHSSDRAETIEASDLILKKWRAYTDETADILAFSGGVPHNTITPIARNKKGLFEMDLVLRNNRTTETHPMGIFHPHEDVHHIKKENIGLIEVMGLAVLPARLKTEIEEIKKFLLGEKSNVASYHLDWAQQIKANHELNDENVNGIIEHELGKKFTRVLEDAGVFKQNEAGIQAFKRFVDSLNHN